MRELLHKSIYISKKLTITPLLSFLTQLPSPRHIWSAHTHPRAHTHPGSSPQDSDDQCSAGPSSRRSHKWVLTNPSKAASYRRLFRTGWAHPRKIMFALHPNWSSFKGGKWEFSAASYSISPISSPVGPARDLPSLWINCIFQGLIKLSWASAWRGTNWHLQGFLKPAVDITVPAAFSCIDPMPDLWNPWWLLTLEAYWSFPRELGTACVVRYNYLSLQESQLVHKELEQNKCFVCDLES